MQEPQEVQFEPRTPRKRSGNYREERPWGAFEILSSGPGFQVKRITVNPRQRLSLQWHRHRDEQWAVARGAARIVVGEVEQTLGRGQSMWVPRTVVHRIENISRIEPLEIIEVQTGDYLGEDDVVRVEDDYGRIEQQPLAQSRQGQAPQHVPARHRRDIPTRIIHGRHVIPVGRLSGQTTKLHWTR